MTYEYRVVDKYSGENLMSHFTSLTAAKAALREFRRNYYWPADLRIQARKVGRWYNR